MRFFTFLLVFSTFFFAVDFLHVEKSTLGEVKTITLEQAIEHCSDKRTRLPTAPKLTEIIEISGGDGLFSIK